MIQPYDSLEADCCILVEFSCFGRSVGVLGWNTLFWEVRKY
jgi:hypothetical protein